MAEALRQLVGEHNYKQDEVLPPGYYTGGTHLRTQPLTWIFGAPTILKHMGGGLAQLKNMAIIVQCLAGWFGSAWLHSCSTHMCSA